MNTESAEKNPDYNGLSGQIRLKILDGGRDEDIAKEMMIDTIEVANLRRYMKERNEI